MNINFAGNIPIMMVEMKIPSPGESINEVQIIRWLKSSGDYVEKDEELCEIDSDKATLTMNAEESGLLTIKIAEGTNAQVGDVACIIDTGAKATSKSKSTSDSESANPEIQYATGHPSPAASKIIREKKLDKENIKGTGRDNRITQDDALKAAKEQKQEPKVPVQHRVGNRIARNEKREKMSMLRKKVSERLVSVKQQTAMLTTFNEVDMNAIIDIRKKHKDRFKEKHQVGLGFMSFFTKAVCEALKLFPVVNARIEGDEIIYHDYCDIGIAVSAPKGLMVPVLRNAEAMSFAEIENNITELAAKARDGKLTIEEMTGGTFTITNGGVFGSMLSTPILNPPQSAILGMHNIVERPVVINGKVAIRPVMYLALSYDHRIIDGKDSVSFLLAVKQMLENPVKLLHSGQDPVLSLLDL